MGTNETKKNKLKEETGGRFEKLKEILDDCDLTLWDIIKWVGTIILWVFVWKYSVPALCDFGSEIIKHNASDPLTVEEIEKEVRGVYKKKYRSLIVVNNLSAGTVLQKIKLFTSDGIIITSKDLSLSNVEDNIVLGNFDKKKLFKDNNSLKIVLETESSVYEKLVETNPTSVTVVEISETDIKK